jgi:hypothetical protein
MLAKLLPRPSERLIGGKIDDRPLQRQRTAATRDFGARRERTNALVLMAILRL